MRGRDLHFEMLGGIHDFVLSIFDGESQKVFPLLIFLTIIFGVVCQPVLSVLVCLLYGNVVLAHSVDRILWFRYYR